MPSFTQRNMFDVLDIEDGPEYEQVVEEYVYHSRATLTCRIPEEPQPAATESAPVSKSAKKRAARAARLAAEAEEKKALESTANGKSSSNSTKAVAAPAKSQQAPAETKVASSETTNAPTSQVDQTPAPSKQSSSPPTSAFKPDLPADLPTRTAEELPANRKRKTPVDFSPSGPGSALTPTSPSKNSVKFEDGVVPGEGAEGEKTIAVKAATEVVAPPKKQNFIERTVWTFIMIFGFIG